MLITQGECKPARYAIRCLHIGIKSEIEYASRFHIQKITVVLNKTSGRHIPAVGNVVFYPNRYQQAQRLIRKMTCPDLPVCMNVFEVETRFRLKSFFAQKPKFCPHTKLGYKDVRLH